MLEFGMQKHIIIVLKLQKAVLDTLAELGWWGPCAFWMSCLAALPA